jgi:membrane protein DedA with SNARE-associated domain
MPSLDGPLPYLAVLIAAAVEGEVVFAAAAALVAAGRLHPVGVCIAGALGAAAGDQAYFYGLRRHVGRLMARLPGERHRQALVTRVRRHATLAVVAIRFVPGLRITLTALCAYAGIPGWRFSLLNLLSAFVWSATLMTALAFAGPRLLARLGAPESAARWLPGLLMLGVVAGVALLVRRDVRRQTALP